MCRPSWRSGRMSCGRYVEIRAAQQAAQQQHGSSSSTAAARHGSSSTACIISLSTSHTSSSFACLRVPTTGDRAVEVKTQHDEREWQPKAAVTAERLTDRGSSPGGEGAPSSDHNNGPVPRLNVGQNGKHAPSSAPSPSPSKSGGKGEGNNGDGDGDESASSGLRA